MQPSYTQHHADCTYMCWLHMFVYARPCWQGREEQYAKPGLLVLCAWKAAAMLTMIGVAVDTCSSQATVCLDQKTVDSQVHAFLLRRCVLVRSNGRVPMHPLYMSHGRAPSKVGIAAPRDSACLHVCFGV